MCAFQISVKTHLKMIVQQNEMERKLLLYINTHVIRMTFSYLHEKINACNMHTHMLEIIIPVTIAVFTRFALTDCNVHVDLTCTTHDYNIYVIGMFR